MEIEFQVVESSQLDKSHRSLFSGMLKKQGKVQGDLSEKADRCKCICIAKLDGTVAAVGAIKQKTASNFTNAKAGVPELSSYFKWELGYLFTDAKYQVPSTKYQGRGLASSITENLIRHFGDGNLMASTEITVNPGMVKILERNGFRLYGNLWKSAIHKNYLGLYLKFK